MTFRFIIIAPMILVSFGIIICIIGASINIKSANSNIEIDKHIIELGIMSIIIACICGIISVYLLVQAEKTGLANREDFKQITIQEFINHRDKTFEQTINSKKEFQPKSLIIIYRYGSPDCEENYDELKKLEDKVPTYYVESRSNLGKELIKQYNINSVPSILLWDENSNIYQHIEIKDLKNNIKERDKIKELIDKISPNNLNQP